MAEKEIIFKSRGLVEIMGTRTQTCRYWTTAREERLAGTRIEGGRNTASSMLCKNPMRTIVREATRAVVAFAHILRN